MNTSVRMLATALVLLMAAGCNRQGPEVPRGVDDNKTVEDYGEGVQSVVVNPNAAKGGSAVDDQGAISTPAHEFAAGQPIYISVPTQFGRKSGESLEVFWFHEDGRSRKDDKKTIAGPFTTFELIAKDAGPYNVEVDASGVPTDVKVVERSGERSRDLDRAVTDAVRKWRFEPAMKDGKPVAGAVVVPVEFKSR